MERFSQQCKIPQTRLCKNIQPPASVDALRSSKILIFALVCSHVPTYKLHHFFPQVPSSIVSQPLLGGKFLFSNNIVKIETNKSELLKPLTLSPPPAHSHSQPSATKALLSVSIEIHINGDIQYVAFPVGLFVFTLA